MAGKGSEPVPPLHGSGKAKHKTRWREEIEETEREVVLFLLQATEVQVLKCLQPSHTCLFLSQTGVLFLHSSLAQVSQHMPGITHGRRKGRLVRLGRKQGHHHITSTKQQVVLLSSQAGMRLPGGVSLLHFSCLPFSPKRVIKSSPAMPPSLSPKRGRELTDWGRNNKCYTM